MKSRLTRLLYRRGSPRLSLIGTDDVRVMQPTLVVVGRPFGCRTHFIVAIVVVVIAIDLHTSAYAGTILGRVQTLLRLLRGIDLRRLGRWAAGRVRRHHHRGRAHQTHRRSCARPHQQRTALVIERDHLQRRTGRTIFTVLITDGMYTHQTSRGWAYECVQYKRGRLMSSVAPELILHHLHDYY